MISGCTEIPKAKVKYAGSLHQIMIGNLEPSIFLDTIPSDNLYALGVCDHLNGEVQVLNGEFMISRVEQDSIIINNSRDQTAALLVYAHVKDWLEIKITEPIANIKDLEGFVQAEAELRGISTEDPFAFLVQGKASHLKGHIMTGENAGVHSGSHAEMGRKIILSEAEGEFLGFFSEEHQGIFTHHNSNSHIHFVVNDKTSAGHLDEVMITQGSILKIPKS